MSLATLLGPELIFPRLEGTDADGVLRDLAERVAAVGAIDDADRLYAKLREREELGSTGIGRGVAVPHCKMKRLGSSLLAVGLSAAPVEFAALDGAPVRIFFLLVSPEGSPGEHLRALAEISRWAKVDEHLVELAAASGADAIYDLFRQQPSAV